MASKFSNKNSILIDAKLNIKKSISMFSKLQIRGVYILFYLFVFIHLAYYAYQGCIYLLKYCEIILFFKRMMHVKL